MTVTTPFPTPWGPAVTVNEIALGIMFVETASHGGYFLNPERNAKVPEAWRQASFNRKGLAGWYEEDCDWCLVALTFPEFFPEGADRAARATFNHFAKRHGLPMLDAAS